jgi:hypothetical protein
MITQFEIWKNAIINNGQCTYSPFTENAAIKRYHVNSCIQEYNIEYETLNDVLHDIFIQSLFPLFDGSLEHAEEPAHYDKLFVHFVLEDSLMTIYYTYAFDDEDKANEFAEWIEGEVYDNNDEDSLYFLTD